MSTNSPAVNNTAAPAANVSAPTPVENEALNVVSDATENEATNESESQEQPESKPESVKRLNKLKLKVFGEELEEELPFAIDENPEAVDYLTKQLQLSKAAQRAMQDKASYEQQVKSFFQTFQSDTKKALLQMGIDPKEFAAAVIEEEIKKAQMSPEELEKQELQMKLKELEEENKRKEEEYKKKEIARIQQIEYERIDNQISEALETTTIPKTPYVVRKIAEFMLLGAKNNVELTPADVIPLVREELMGDLKNVLNSMDENAAEEFIGKEVLTRFRKKNLAKAKSTPVTPATVKAGIKDVAKATKEQLANATKQDKVDYKKFFGF